MVVQTLSRLRDLALALPRPGCEWESQPTFDPPATAEEVANFECSWLPPAGRFPAVWGSDRCGRWHVRPQRVLDRRRESAQMDGGRNLTP